MPGTSKLAVVLLWDIMPPMPRWLSVAWLIALPCFLALVAYDAVAMLLLKRGASALVPAHDLARGVAQDAGLAVAYAVTVPPRVIKVVADYSQRTRRLCLVMLGLGIAWYDVLCASMTRVLAEPPGLGISVVVLFVIPILLAPAYVQWLKTWVSRDPSAAA
ncbi:MAG: hypothetical protein HY581_11640 [Nitrospirae bacterium]|nr:hypothetical protein [Nitrospirota bacterium]